METASLSTEIKTQFKIGLLIWMVASFFAFYQNILQASPSLMVNQLHKDLGMSLPSIGWLTAAFYFSYMPMQVPAGLVVDQFGTRKLLTICVAVTAVATILFAVSHEARLNFTARVAMGFVTAPSICAALFLASNWLPRNKFALFVGLTQMIANLGGALGEEMLSLSVDKWGWRLSMFTLGVVGAVLVVVTWIIIRDRPAFSVQPKQPDRRVMASMWKDLCKIVKNHRLWIAALSAGGLYAPLPAFASLWAIPFLRDVYHFSLERAAFASSLIYWGSAVGMPIVGYISEYYDRRKFLLILGSLGSLITFITISFVHFTLLWEMFVLMFVLGFFASGYVMGFAVARDVCQPAQRTSAMGFVNMWSMVFGTVMLQPLFGKLLDFHHVHYYGHKLKTSPLIASDFQFASLSIVVVLLIALLISFFVEETYCLPQYGSGA